MIKVTFKEPQITDDGVLCMFALGHYICYPTDDEISLFIGEYWLGNEIYEFYPSSNIQSIEHVKPTDL